MTLFGRSLTKELDLTPGEFEDLIKLAADLKAAKRSGTEVPRLTGKNIALIFEKTSTRTRCAFEVAAADQGARTVYLDPSGSQIGHKESVRDTARVLGRMFDGIEFRGTRQSDVEDLAGHAGVPVWNGLTDEWHPTQSLADILTVTEHVAKPLGEIALTYLGDARNNVGNSLLVTGAMLGMDVRIAAPPSLWPAADVIAEARRWAERTGARINVTDVLSDAVAGADFLYTDVWVSMGEPKEVWDTRIELLRPYQVNAAAMAATGNPGVRFLHCLPAYHDTATAVGREVYERTGMTALEVTDEVFDSPASIVFDQAENRLHTIKALMVATLGASSK
jgi:ornithine carbamoyltransferase